jgi:hypothetical protein
MTLSAERPCALVFKGSWRPCCSTMACLAVGAELRGSMGRIGSLIIVVQVTTHTGTGRIRINTPDMTLVTTRCNMRTGKGIVIIVNCECSGFPSRVGTMAVGAGRGNVGSLVVRICSGSIIDLMTTHTSIGGIRIYTTNMALVTTRFSMTLG